MIAKRRIGPLPSGDQQPLKKAKLKDACPPDGPSPIDCASKQTDVLLTLFEVNRLALEGASDPPANPCRSRDFRLSRRDLLSQPCSYDLPMVPFLNLELPFLNLEQGISLGCPLTAKIVA